jgi:eukaryotic-like serine/threonine-protein kinase
MTLQMNTAKKRAEHTTQFMVDIFKAADPELNGGNKPSASDLSIFAAQRFEAETAKDASDLGELLPVLIDVQMGLGNAESAVDLANQWFEQSGGDKKSQASALIQRAYAHRAAGRRELAKADLQTLNNDYLMQLSDTDLARKTLLDGTYLFESSDDAEVALKKFVEAEQQIDRTGDQFSPWRIQAILEQAGARSYLDDFQSAEQQLTQLLDSLPKGSQFNASRMRILTKLALVAGQAKSFDKELKWALEANALAESLFGPEHMASANALNRVGAAYRHLGVKDQALTIQRQVVARMHRAAEPTDVRQAGPLLNLASMTTDPAEKIDAYERALKFLELVSSYDRSLGVEVREQLITLSTSALRQKELRSELCERGKKLFCQP